MSVTRFVTASLALAAVALLLAPTAAAHASANTADGKYRVTWGFLDEPAFTHQKNRLDLVIRENATGAGVAGLTADNLTVSLHYGEEEYDLGDISAYRGAKGASAGAGNYTSANPVMVTRAGIYTLHVEGDILGSPVDLDIPAAHEYEPMSEIMFPDEFDFGGDTSALQAEIDALEARLAALEAKVQTQSSTPATVTEQPAAPNGVPAPGLALVCLALVAATLLARRRA